ncbi:GTP-binding protein [Shewanella olleyana]|uniref:CobW family GTP-binding protein n=1 Tax=Shewanella olleyana TaxID=135626 RepID=UPI00200BFD2A|nr:GTP-binding protein [Shewanella olleyana]MCL1067415.1 GTP-binding protein [Shewanella olleyana]
MNAIPVTILTGFLGAGKTTLLNHILTETHNLKIAVIVNDFGSINIDAGLIKSEESSVMTLENGCICCSLAEGLVVAVMRILAIKGEDRPDHIVIETSGVSEPYDIAKKFSEEDFKDSAPLNAIVTTIDAENVMKLDGAMADLAVHQVECGDIVLVNKVDLVTKTKLDQVLHWCREHSPLSKLINVQYGAVELPILFDVEEIGKRSHLHDAAKPDSEKSSSKNLKHQFETFSYETQMPISLERIYPLLERISIDIYRMKGILNLIERPDRQCIFQCTGQRATVTVGDEWLMDSDKKSQLVFIAPSGKVDFDKLANAIDNLVNQ